jgi:hypothetical protein
MLSHRNRRSAGLLTIALSMLATLVVAAPVAASNPPGNNGTVKIDRLAFDDHPNNQPHVGCTFQVDFYGFDADATYFANVVFELHSPTADGRTMSVTGNLNPFIGEDDNSGAGSEAGLDASQTYTLKLTGAAHAQQGHHVKLTVHAPGSQGADTKHKVFWVTGCDPSTPLTPPNPLTPTTPVAPSTPPSSGIGTPLSGTLGSSSVGTPQSGTLGSSSGPAAQTLPDTSMSGATTSSLVLVGLVFLGGSTMAAVAVRSERTRRR